VILAGWRRADGKGGAGGLAQEKGNQIWSFGLSYPDFEEVNQSFHTCAQDVQITRMANNNGKIAQCYDYNINRVYPLQNDP
jgi:hypothetical protein